MVRMKFPLWIKLKHENLNTKTNPHNVFMIEIWEFNTNLRCITIFNQNAICIRCLLIVHIYKPPFLNINLPIKEVPCIRFLSGRLLSIYTSLLRSLMFYCNMHQEWWWYLLNLSSRKKNWNFLDVSIPQNQLSTRILELLLIWILVALLSSSSKGKKKMVK